MKAHDIKKWQLFIVGFITYGIVRLSSLMLENKQYFGGIVTIVVGIIIIVVFYLVISRKYRNKNDN